MNRSRINARHCELPKGAKQSSVASLAYWHELECKRRLLCPEPGLLRLRLAMTGPPRRLKFEAFISGRALALVLPRDGPASRSDLRYLIVDIWRQTEAGGIALKRRCAHLAVAQRDADDRRGDRRRSHARAAAVSIEAPCEARRGAAHHGASGVGEAHPQVARTPA